MGHGASPGMVVRRSVDLSAATVRDLRGSRAPAAPRPRCEVRGRRRDRRPGHGPARRTRSGADAEAGEGRGLGRRPPSRTCATVFLLSLANGCSSRTFSLKKPLTRPSTILGSAASGLPSSRAVGLGDPALVLDRLGRDVVAGQDARAERGDVHARRRARRPRRQPSAATRTPIWAGRSGLVLCRYDVDDAALAGGPRGGPRSSRRWWRWPRRAGPARSCRARSRWRAASRRRPASEATACSRTWSARAMKRSPLATKSVSQLTSTSVPTPSPASAATRPLEAERPSRLVMPFRPLTRRSSAALSRSPSASSRAFFSRACRRRSARAAP